MADRARPPAIAAIDIGSNSLKLAVARLDGSGAIEEFDWAIDTVRLGRGLDLSGSLAEDRIEAALASLAQMEARARAQGAERVLAVATEAVRGAANGAQFLERVLAETGIEAEIISGDREAELSFSGMAAVTDLAGDVVLADIGGASTEVMVARDGDLIRAASQPVGSGRLADRLLTADPPTAAELASCRASARSAFEQSPVRPLPRGAGVRLLLAGGTGELMGKLAGGSPWSVREAEAALALTSGIPSAALAEQLGIQPLRARVLPAGMAAAMALADMTAPGSIAAARNGIRTGLFMEAFGVRRVSGRVKSGLSGNAPE